MDDDDLFPPRPPPRFLVGDEPARPEAAAPVDKDPALSVGDLGRALKRAVESGWPMPVWVFGEVTGARPAPKGHHYFSLRDEDEDASVDMVMYRTSLTPRARGLLVDGSRVKLRGKPTMWTPRGRLQFVVDRVEAAGKGALLEALERLKEKLTAEGLFDASRKRKLPADPRVVGVVTSATGAVIHDICKVAFRRGGARILLSPATVQGATAPASIVRALQMLQKVPEVDVIIIGRGGGSLEDLLAFSDEAVVRAIARSPVPVVSAVGHEVDVSLADFAADARAATPSQAAELVVPDRAAKRAMLEQLQKRLVRSVRARVETASASLHRARTRLGDPRLAMAAHQQRLDDRRARLATVTERRLVRSREERARLASRLERRDPLVVLAAERTRLARGAERLRAAFDVAFARRVSSLQAVAGRLDGLSPLKVLARGYAIAQTSKGRAVRLATDVKAGERILIRTQAARLVVDVVAVSATKPGSGDRGAGGSGASET